MTTDDTAELTYLFRYGADMDPRRIRRELPTARFVARAHVEIAGADTWGILLATPEPVIAEARLTVTTDDGRGLAAIVQTTDADLAEAKVVLTQIRYWELPLAYAQRWEARVPDADVFA
jgi:hypothetical protein